jgi:hypothetical protein
VQTGGAVPGMVRRPGYDGYGRTLRGRYGRTSDLFRGTAVPYIELRPYPAGATAGATGTAVPQWVRQAGYDGCDGRRTH